LPHAITFNFEAKIKPRANKDVFAIVSMSTPNLQVNLILSLVELHSHNG